MQLTEDEQRIAFVALAGLERLYDKLTARDCHDDRLIMAIQNLKAMMVADEGVAFDGGVPCRRCGGPKDHAAHNGPMGHEFEPLI